MIQKKSQAWSFDIMLALIVFIGAFFLFFGFFIFGQAGSLGQLKNDAVVILDDLSNDGGAIDIVERNRVNNSNLGDLLVLNYTQLKRQLGIQSDFCIYFEDEEGNIIYLNASNITGKGSNKINISDVPCFQGS